MTRYIEDTTFRYAGYAKAWPRELAEGDAVRFGPEPGPCWLVEGVGTDAKGVHIVISDRSVAVAGFFADVLKRAFEGMAGDTFLQIRTVKADEPVWIRL